MQRAHFHALAFLALAGTRLDAQTHGAGAVMFADRVNEIVTLDPVEREHTLQLVDAYNDFARPIRTWLEHQHQLGATGAGRHSIDSASNVMARARARLDDSLRAMLNPRQRVLWDSASKAANPSGRN